MEFKMPDTNVSPTLFIPNIERGILAHRTGTSGPEGLRIEVDGSVAHKAILLDKSRAVEFNTEEWIAWTIGRGSKSVTCEHVIPGEFSDGHDEQGNPWGKIMDSSLNLPYTRDHVLDAFENSITLKIKSPIEELQKEVGCPFFLVSTPNQQPSEHSVLVELAFDQMDELPDVKAFVAFYLTLHHHHKEFISIDYPNVTDQKLLAHFLKLTRRMHPRPGHYFPIYVQQEKHPIPGVLVLEKYWGGLLSRRKRQFRARVYLSERMESLPENTVLYRRVEWQEQDKLCYEQAEIARIIRPLR